MKVEFVNTRLGRHHPALDRQVRRHHGRHDVTPQRNLRVNFGRSHRRRPDHQSFRKDKGEIKSFQDLNDPKYKIAGQIPGTTSASNRSSA